jgi:hypothetical protein
MLTAICISADRKLAGQLQMWIHQGMGDKLCIEAYTSIEAYKVALETANDEVPKQAPPPGAPPEAPSAKDDPGKKVRVFILDVDSLGAKPVQAVVELQRITKEKAPVWVDIGTPRVLMMAFEAGTMRVEVFQHDAIDDLILKPLDKTLFQQKMEFLVAESSKISPTFLFRAKTQQIIEVGRDVIIDEISEFAAAIRSPGPVPEGAFAAIHGDVFGVKGARRIIGRVYESGKHPVREGEYIVRFAYFGISTEQLSTVRRYIRGNQTQVRSRTFTPPMSATKAASTPAAAQAKLGLTKELTEKMALLRMRKVAVIDMNQETLNEAKSLLEGGFKGIVVRSFPSYARFMFDLRQLIPPTPVKPAPAALGPETGKIPTTGKDTKGSKALTIEQTFPTGKKLSVIVRGKSHDLVRFDPDLKKSDIVLGKSVSEWLERPDLWKSFIENDDKESFEEFTTFVEGGPIGRCSFRMHDETGRVVYIEAAGRLDKAGGDGSSQLLRIEMTELDQEAWEKAIAASYGATGAPNKDPSSFKFEAILIDGAMLRPTPVAWYEQFVESLRKARVITADEAPPKVIVMSDLKSRTRNDGFRIKGIASFVYKPLDRRYMIQLIHALCPQLALSRAPESSEYVLCELSAKLGKEVIMDEVSEYGLTIQHPSAFRDKSHMRFFSRLFGEEGEWVAGRCHACEKNGTGEGHRCHFMYFGPGEELLQRIRRWIREDHVARKEKA